MTPRARFQRLAWAFAVAAAVVLKAAVPLLAATAAAAQGLPVAEICSVYGVRAASLALPAGPQQAPADAGHPHDHHLADDDAAGPAPQHAPGAGPQHGGEHCALTALGALAPAAPPAALLPAADAAAAQPDCRPAHAPARDACARWSALHKQGPPPAG